MAELTIKNVGPINYINIPLPDEGGVVVMRGEQGVGKSSVLDSVQNVLDGSGKLPISDGARHAVVDGLGVHVQFGNRRSSTGELTVRSLNGFPLGDFVNPGYDNPKANDSRRIKALLGLCGTGADLQLFEGIVEGIGYPLTELLTPKTIALPDLVGMAEGIKRDLQAKALIVEKDAEKLESVISQRRASMSDVANPEVSSAEAEQRQMEATKEVGRLTQVAAETKRAADRWDAAKKSVDESGNYDASERLAEIEGHIADAKAVEAEELRWIQKLQDELSERKERLEAVRRNLVDIVSTQSEIIRKTSSVAAAMDVIKSERPDVNAANADQEQAVFRLTTANELVNVAKQWEIRERLSKEVQQLSSDKSRKDRGAKMLREAAKRTDEILSDTICKLIPHMRVEEERLLYNYPKRGKYIPFDELSQGEAYSIAIDIAASVLGVGGVFVLSQAAWGELNDRSRAEVAIRCREKGCTMLTAQATLDPELVATIYEPITQVGAAHGPDGAARNAAETDDIGAAGGEPVSALPETGSESTGDQVDLESPLF